MDHRAMEGRRKGGADPFRQQQGSTRKPEVYADILPGVFWHFGFLGISRDFSEYLGKYQHIF
jgi:hypothetical protein